MGASTEGGEAPGQQGATTDLLALRRRGAWPALVPFVDEAPQFLDRLGVVVHLQPQDGVVVQPDAAVLLHYDDRGRLLPALVASAGLAAFERGDEALREVTAGLLERVDHVLDDRRSGEDVALSGRVLAAFVSGPLGRFRPGVRGIFALQVHH